jgi:hypothetical protein
MNDSNLASVAPGLSSLGIGIETSPRHSSPLLLIVAALWRYNIAFVRYGWQRIAFIVST